MKNIITNPCAEIPLLPTGKRIYSNLSVDSGIFATKEELDSVRNRVIIDNREGKLNPLLMELTLLKRN